MKQVRTGPRLDPSPSQAEGHGEQKRVVDNVPQLRFDLLGDDGGGAPSCPGPTASAI